MKGIIETKIVTEYWMLAAIVPEAFKGDKYSGLGQFKGKTVGTTKGYEYPDELKKWEGLKTDETSDSYNSLRKVANGRIDVMFDDPLWADIKSKDEHLKYKILMPLASSMPTIGGFAPKHGELVKKFEATASALIKEGVLDKLYVKYTGQNLKAFKKKYGIK